MVILCIYMHIIISVCVTQILIIILLYIACNVPVLCCKHTVRYIIMQVDAGHSAPHQVDGAHI